MSAIVTGGVLAAIASVITAFLVRTSRDWMLKIFSTSTSVLFMWGFHALVKASPGRALYIQKKITETYFTPPTEWAGFIAAYLEQMTGTRIDLQDIIRGGAVPGSKSFIETVGEKFLHPMLNMIMPDPRGEGGIRPEDGVDGAERFLGTNLQFQLGAWLLHVLGDMQSFGMFKSLKDLPNAISWAYGIGWLSWLVMGTPFRMGIADPLEEFYNLLYHPAKLTQAPLTRAFIQGIIGSEEYNQEMSKLGYTDHRKELLYRLAEKDYTDAHLKRLFKLGVIDESNLVEEFQRRGYNREKAEMLAYIVDHEDEIKLTEDIAGEALKGFEDGEVDKETVRSYLGQAGYTSREITLFLDLYEMRRAFKKRLSEGEIYSLIRKEVIDWPEARDMLEKRGFSWWEAENKLKAHIPKDEWITS